MDRRTDEIDCVVVDTDSGRLAGQRQGDVLSFLGVPFGKPPLGPMRWRVAEPCLPWTGTRDATRYGFVCPQVVSQVEAFTGGMMGAQSEDCLYLNIWTPGCDSAKRPVMVWIHGGGFVTGAGSQRTYNGRHLAARDVVVVTINYRMGAFGFLNLNDATNGHATGSGAEGLGDQVLALEWVKRNITAFGGDAENVTIFGESAGGMSVSTLLATPSAQGLFHKAIPQSGGADICYDRERSARVAHAWLDTLGLDDPAKLADVPTEAILKAQTRLLAAALSGRDTRKLGGLPFQPTIDGALLPQRPINTLRANAARNIPLLTGTTREEWKLFTAANPRLRLMTANGLAERVTRLESTTATAMLQAYDEGSPFERFNAIMTDKTFTVPMVRLLDTQAREAPQFAYRFDWRSPLLGGIMGSCHALELGFVFGTHGQKLARSFFGAGPVAETLSSTMMDCWTTFARTGNPSTPATGAWPRYDEARDVMIFGDGAPRIVRAPNAERMCVWDNFPERKIGT